jgi:putative transcriptional regulator
MKDEPTIVRYRPDPDDVQAPDWSRVDAMTAEERHAAALSDPDAQPASKEQLARGRNLFVRHLRRRLRLTQEEFAARYHLPPTTVREWEEGVRELSDTERAYLRAIAQNPDGVLQARGTP